MPLAAMSADSPVSRICRTFGVGEQLHPVHAVEQRCERRPTSLELLRERPLRAIWIDDVAQVPCCHPDGLRIDLAAEHGQQVGCSSRRFTRRDRWSLG